MTDMDNASKLMFIKTFMEDKPGQYLIELLQRAKDEYTKERKAYTDFARKASDFTPEMIEKVVEYAHYEEAYDEVLAFLKDL